MRMHRGLWSWFGAALVLLTLSAGPRLAVGQDADVQALLEQGRKFGADVEQMRTVAERARRAGLGTDATASLLRPAVALAEQDLPTGSLLSKTLEGLAKQVPVTRMQPVLQQYRTHTEQAGQLVAQWTRRSEVRQLLGATEKDPDAGPQKAERTRLVTAVTEAQQQDVPAKNIPRRPPRGRRTPARVAQPSGHGRKRAARPARNPTCPETELPWRPHDSC